VNDFGYLVGNIHNAGDWIDYQIKVPADGVYAFWVYYGAHNRPFGNSDMGGRTAIRVDGGEQVLLSNLPDTGGWGTFRWACAASVRLTQGEHRLRWQNLKGGGLSLEAFALASDPAWKPDGNSLPKPAANQHVILIQAENFATFQGKQLSVSGSEATGSATEFQYAPGTFKPAWAQSPEAEVHIFQSSSCRAFKEIVSLAGVDEATRTVKVRGPECVVPLRAGDRYFVENILEELDSPGEWYLDRKTGRLYWWPDREPAESRDVVAPLLGRVVQLLATPRPENRSAICASPG